jgi:hypothetical protein
VGPRAGLNAAAKKTSHHIFCRELKPCRPARSLVSILTELPQFLMDFVKITHTEYLTMAEVSTETKKGNLPYYQTCS